MAQIELSAAEREVIVLSLEMALGKRSWRATTPKSIRLITDLADRIKVGEKR